MVEVSEVLISVAPQCAHDRCRFSSTFLVLGKNATETFLAAERDLLTETFPNGTVEERYVVSLAVATR
ncbi:hypothetical protein [Streptomyces yerevanensis]|uniref:hypothetical protein n=1 Tax=Streptomyces yerevanensis TaxID=66378 RepID=UPI000524B81E|nr:hypothetical protein [Streptomyces yerevanensis]